MRITVKWYSIVVTILFIGQSMLVLLLLQPKHDINNTPLPHQQLLPPSSSKESPDAYNLQSLSLSPTESCTPADLKLCEPKASATDVEGMAYLYNKFWVAATEVKRQVLKGKGKDVPELPNKVHAQCKPNLVAATYNLWNINPPWPTRLKTIVDLIKEIGPHIVGVQEIRKFEGKNQLDILKEHLAKYKYSVYEKVQDEQQGEEEGLGILSKYPILESSSINFGNTNRKCLQSLIQTPHGNINFFVTHFSLNDIEQCTHALMLWEHLNSFPPDVPQILVGDMNTYFDFEWPMDLLTQGLTLFMLGPLNPCSNVLKKNLVHRMNQTLNYHVVKDAWEELYPAIPKNEHMPASDRWWGSWAAPPGHTFSNYDDQDPSRTDRLYFYSPEQKTKENKKKESYLKLCDVTLFGNTPIQDEQYKNKILYPSDHKGVAGYFCMEPI
eukprot:Phypoly_transcript_07209.p1 GENE.Phypoly_transcript_07209~~Phypoly_transcript_07209.p1  ORF type:complete len:439 (+),score=51.74 Phypoly_transcript_07209:338-1654(+)